MGSEDATVKQGKGDVGRTQVGGGVILVRGAGAAELCAPQGITLGFTP